MTFRISVLILFATLIAIPGTAMSGKQPIHVRQMLEKADLKNGKEMFETGKRSNGSYLIFSAGPTWLHSDGGGCASCHGTHGRGGTEPESCYTVAPPIAYKFLAGNGYPTASRKSGEHPIFTLKNIRYAIEIGVTPNDRELDFCMPRFKLKNKDFDDLIGYLIELNKHP